MEKIICQSCGKEFEATKWKKRKFCSRDCYLKFHASREEVICKECGKKFEASKHKRRQFCSVICNTRFMVRERDKGKRVWWQCSICKKKFWWQKHTAKSRKYCSPKCQAVGASYRLRGKIRKNRVVKREGKIYPHSDRIYDKGKRKILHRYLVEQKIGRELKAEEHVHHKDMDKFNNGLGNLYLYRNASEHQKGHRSIDKLVKGLCKDKIIIFEDGIYKRGNGKNRKG